MKIIPVGAELFHATDTQNGQADRQTDMENLIDTFLQICESTHLNALWSYYSIIPSETRS
jgi:hypothetical protein